MSERPAHTGCNIEANCNDPIVAKVQTRFADGFGGIFTDYACDDHAREICLEIVGPRSGNYSEYDIIRLETLTDEDRRIILEAQRA